MNNRDLLIEIGLEEIPARFVAGSVQQLGEKLESWLKENRINYHSTRLFSTPRRLAVLVEQVSDRQKDSSEEAKGPARKVAQTESGEWTKAAIGFSRGQGKSVEDIYFKTVNGVEYAHIKKFIEGEPTSNLLPGLKNIITGLSFPKNMRWANEELKYIRPIKWIVTLFGEEIIPFEIAHVHTGTMTLGHRFLGGSIQLSSPKEYEKALLDSYVIADSQKRKSLIESQLAKLEAENNWVIPVDGELLEEVNNLVEYPTALYGRFEEEFLDIPEEVLITSMKEHQRYFPVKSKAGELLPYFVTVRNGDERHLETVARGNEKVLRARLSDAAFFYHEDQKLDIADAMQKLDSIVYHEEIGTVAGKAARVRRLANWVSELAGLGSKEREIADRAAEIAKFDLVTQMVYEFPELQGIMGEKYALQKGESKEVARAINEHYMPRNAEDRIPETNPGATVAIAEKLDTISSFFAIQVVPSGSQDPYALRRQATGIIQILLQKNWPVKLEKLVDLSLSLLKDANIGKSEDKEIFTEVMKFFKLRIRHLLQGRGVRYDLIDALLAGEIGSVPFFIEKAQVLQKKKDEEGFKSNMEALSRVINISVKAEEEIDIQPSLFENEYEQVLYEKYLGVGQELESNISAKEYYRLLISIQPEINRYFDHTMVMAEDPAIRANRLAQMAGLAKIIEQFAKFNKIVAK